MNPRRFSTVFAGAVAVLTAGGPSGLIAGDWDGQTIGVQYLLPDDATVFADEGAAVVGGSLEFAGVVGGFFNVDLSATRIVITFLPDDLSIPAQTFSGFRFDDALAAAPSLVGATLNGGLTTVVGLSPSAVTWDADTVYVNLSGVSGVVGDSAVIDLSFEPVPEGSTWATGMIVVPAAGCWLQRRQRRA